ncbi:hypothetical protein M2323_002083 [Rhodoblastus acidophilus]|uniref:glycosyltransferase family 2 protein n=1 Tax=Rhodoblastus acidophilus TaxID=1074 RepID=UPI0022242661|nr:glycosyltransferase family 2 protein [Rhodoblastus acidophilus]MCW2284368.1 hypothetical protein [Rhodoblastus acidophilus]MCW2333154.1 hypothetical protein [Rhodoblastus acidophilus]
MAGWLDIVRLGEVVGWFPVTSEEIPSRLALVVNGQRTGHVAEARPRKDLDSKNISGTGFYFRVALEVGDRVSVIDVQSEAAVNGGVRFVAGERKSPLNMVLVCIMKREEDYLLEWIAYHRLHGFNIIVGDNSDDAGDLQSRLLAELHSAGEIERVDLIGVPYAQMQFFDATLQRFRDENTIIGFLDCDEFLTPVSNRHSAGMIVAEYFSDWSVSAVGFNWACYGSSGHTSKTPGLVIERFTSRAPQNYAANRHVKTFVRGGRAHAFVGNPHAVSLEWGNYLQSDFSKVVWSNLGRGITNAVIWNGLRINHYTIKSREEFQIKGQRGSAISANNSLVKQRQDYFSGYDQNQIQDRALVGQAETVAAQVERIRGKCSAATLE